MRRTGTMGARSPVLVVIPVLSRISSTSAKPSCRDTSVSLCAETRRKSAKKAHQNLILLVVECSNPLLHVLELLIRLAKLLKLAPAVVNQTSELGDGRESNAERNQRQVFVARGCESSP
jgi:hypothetical protein